ncbi:hypothetical protein PQX77_005147 [Marasmius sp. AFHP31]|nr:hypothetical protein PQX77_005147 [Marasmius sp. AFHP31]
MDGSENKVYKLWRTSLRRLWMLRRKSEQLGNSRLFGSHVSRITHRYWILSLTGFMTDGGQELILPDSEKDILDIVTTAKFKKKTGKENLYDNVRKLLENATHMMFSDPRRRFRFGITIEDTQMRFWYFSRALNFVTHDFNFVTNPKPFIQFLLFVVYIYLYVFVSH